MENKIKFLNNLVHINRWSGFQLIKSESVSDHIYSMIALSIDLVPKLNNEVRSGNPLINLQNVIYRIAIHDLPESLCCDIPRNFKYHNVQLHQAIEDTEQKLMEGVLDVAIIKDINNSKNKDTIEGFIVKYLDFLQSALKMESEVMLGNQYIKSEIPVVLKAIDEFLSEDSLINEFFISYLKEYTLVNLRNLIKYS